MLDGKKEPEARVFFGDDDLLKNAASRCAKVDASIVERPSLTMIVQTFLPSGVLSFRDETQAQIALDHGEGVSLICGLYAYNYTICQSGHLRWFDWAGPLAHRRMLDALDASQLSLTDVGMGVRNIVKRSLRWYKKRSDLDDEDYQERLAIQDARYLTNSGRWMDFLDGQIASAYFGAQGQD